MYCLISQSCAVGYFVNDDVGNRFTKNSFLSSVKKSDLQNCVGFYRFIVLNFISLHFRRGGGGGAPTGGLRLAHLGALLLRSGRTVWQNCLEEF